MPTTMTALATVVDPGSHARVEVLSGTGFTITFDIFEEGADRGGPSPTESILASLAACTSMDREAPASHVTTLEAVDSALADPARSAEMKALDESRHRHRHRPDQCVQDA